MALAIQLLVAGPDWAAKTTAIASCALAGAAVMALLSLKDARRSRHAQLITDLSQRWDDRFMHEALTVWREYGPKGTLQLVNALWAPDVKKRDPGDLADWYTISVYPNLLETLGVYVSNGLIAEELVYQLWGGSIADAWRDWAEAVFRLRNLQAQPQVWSYFEYIAGQMRSRLELEERLRSPLRPGFSGE